ncbi:hypothetical protein D1872_217580 [compost metagenome]
MANTFSTENVERYRTNNDRQYRIDGTGQCLIDTVIHDIFYILDRLQLSVLQIVANPVKNNDVIVNGIADNRQNGCNEGELHFNLENTEQRNHQKYVMQKRKHGRHGKPEFKAYRNV